MSQRNSSNGAIRVQGARVHNLRNLDVEIPHNALVVLTGVSGSGKSSLAFDTLFAEGQRRYLESLSAYSRQFLDQLPRPDVDRIEGLPPTVSIQQRSGSIQPRSTLATTTEVYDYLRLLYARAGQAHCPDCGTAVSRQTAQAIVNRILSLENRQRVMILAPLVRGRKGLHRKVFEKIGKEGFVRARVDGRIVDASDPPQLARGNVHDIEAVVDRVVVKPGIRSRLQESVDLALSHGEGTCILCWEQDGTWTDRLYSRRFACPDCGASFPELEPRSFSFNSPYGACPQCDGLGVQSDHFAPGEHTGGKRRMRNRPRAGAPSRRAGSSRRAEDEPSVFGSDTDASPCPECSGARLNAFARAVTLRGRAIHELTSLSIAEAEEFIGRLAAEIDSGEADAELAPEAVPAARKTLPEIVSRLRFLKKVGLEYLSLDRPTRTLSGGEYQRARLAGCLGSGLTGVCYILDEPTVGLHPRDTLRLIGALEELREEGNTVIVVEHDAETIRRADWLLDLGPGPGAEGGRLVAAGAPDDVARESDSPTARLLRAEGAGGRATRDPDASPGEPDASASPGEPDASASGFPRTTGDPDASASPGEPDASASGYAPAGLRPRLARSTPADLSHALTIEGATLNNLQDVTAKVPLNRLVCATGVSGSGKSSLFLDTLVPAVRQILKEKAGRDRPEGEPDASASAGEPDASASGFVREGLRPPPASLRPPPAGLRPPLARITGCEPIDRIVEIDQKPIGRTGRSNPATYTGLWDEVRRAFAQTREARIRGYSPRRFSFNSREGRCATCKGRGSRRIEMQFLPDLYVTCPDCRGARFNRQTLAVRYAGRSAADVLAMRIDEAADFFQNFPKLRARLEILCDVGLGYLCLGQSSLTLSGGEAQRIKLATELSRAGSDHALFVLDEPTTGLHAADVARLISVLRRLVDSGNSVLVIEHQPDVIAAADWLIDLGPEGGREGGRIVAEGPPEEVARSKESHTGAVLRAYFLRHGVNAAG